MSLDTNLAYQMTEKGLLPDSLVRHGIRRLLTRRLEDIQANDAESISLHQQAFIDAMDQSPIALLTEKANEQHYEVPADFFNIVLGDRLKYSCGYWDESVSNIHQSEEKALQLTCEHAQIKNGMHILELGCGWGS